MTPTTLAQETEPLADDDDADVVPDTTPAKDSDAIMLKGLEVVLQDFVILKSAIQASLESNADLRIPMQ